MHKSMFVAALVPVLAFGAGEYTWVGNASSSWADPASYTLGGQPVNDPPPAGATVIFTRDAQASITDDSVAYVSSLGRLQVAPDAEIGVSLTVSNAVLGCAIVGASKTAAYGKVVKTGPYALTLLATGRVLNTKNQYIDYLTNFDVQGGEVIFPNGNVIEFFGGVSVESGATVRLPTTTDAYVDSISGAGTISCAATTTRTLRIKGSGTTDFSGTLTGAKLALDVYYSSLNLMGVVNDFAGNVAVNAYNGGSAVLGVAKFGMKADAVSSIGTDDSIDIESGGGMIRCLNPSEETTDKNFAIAAAEAKAADVANTGFDAGAYGGVTFAGNWTLVGADMRWLLLTGSNTAHACTMAGGMSDSFTLTKRGAGVWKFSGTKNLAGAINVDDGTLQFDSLGEKGESCALGTATMLFEEKSGAKADLQAVDYAIRLGDAEAGTEGTLEYDGEGFAGAKERPIALKGDGRIIHSGTNGFIRLRGVSALTPGAKTLTLDGEAVDGLAADCELADIVDADDRKISVVKEGSGFWALTGNQDIRGTIRVKGGTLCLRNPVHFTWFRWILKEPVTASGGNYRVCEFGLFDANSNRVNAAMSIAPEYADAHGNLQYGEANFTNSVKTHSTSKLSDMFDDSSSSVWRSNYSGMTFDRNDKSTWIPIVMHVGADRPVASFDFAPYWSPTQTGVSPKVFALEGSADGATWHEVFADDSVEVSNTHWHYQDESFVAGARHEGRLIDTSVPQNERTMAFLDNVESVRIDAGATLKLEGDVSLGRIVVDSTGAGTIAGGSFAENGVIDVIADPEAATTELPLTFDGVAGVENVPAWTLKVNGADSTGHKLKLVNGKLCLKKTGGLILIFR